MWLRRCAVAVLVSWTLPQELLGETIPIPFGGNRIVFDGQNIWLGGSGLIKLRESDGALLGTFAAQAMDGMAFDGAHVWWSNLAGRCLGKTRASDGALLGCFLSLSQAPRGMASDGAHVWAAVENGTVVKIRTSDNALVGTFPVGASPHSVLFDGANIWVSATGDGVVRKYRASDGLNLGTFASGSTPAELAFDGTNVWVVNLINSTVTKLRASDGANLGTFFAGWSPNGLAVWGSHVFVASGGALSVLRASDGWYLGKVALEGTPSKLLRVGSSLWVPGGGGINTVSKLRYPFAIIGLPEEMSTFAVGQTLLLSGRGIDATGELPPSRLSWTVVMRHEAHTHPVLGPITGNPVPFIAPPPESLAAVNNSELEVRLTVTQGGASHSVARSVRPRKVAVTFATTPPGLGISVNGTSLVGPQNVLSWENYLLVATAPSWQPVGPDGYVFASWSSGAANPIVIPTPSVHATYTASYLLSNDSGPQSYFTITPCRLVDTRWPDGSWGGPRLAAGGTRDFTAWGSCDIPVTARALAVNVTVTEPDGPGHLRVFPSDGLAIGTSTSAVVFANGRTRGSNTMARLGPAGGLSVFNGMPSGSTHFILDVFGYFE
jgi:hypothetical protein